MSELTPIPDEESGPFFAGAAAGRLTIQRCTDCGAFSFPFHARCTRCGARKMTWVDASGRGRLFSHSVVHVALHPELAARVPYTVATVDLDEGVRCTTELIETDGIELRAGLEVEATFVLVAPDVVLPKFRPRRTG